MSFAHYLLQVNLYLIVFYGFYKLLLDKETYFLLNRIYLVSAGILSLCIPFIRLEWLTEQKAAQQVYTSVNWEAVLQQATIVTDGNDNFSWGNAFVYIYSAGIVVCLGRLAYNLFAVKKLIKNAKAGSAFSFFSKKVVDQDLPLIDVIDIHEEAHIKQWHTADILFFEVLGVFTWINPIVYFYKKSIKNIHEFLADEHAADFQGDKAEYAMLILSQSFGISPNRLTNGFFDKSLIKKRIFMLQKERSKKTAIMKYGFFIPLFAILIIFSSATVRKNEKLIAITNQIPLEKPIEMVQDIIIPEPVLTTKTISKGEIVPTTEKVDGNWNHFYGFMARSIKYPSEAQQNNLQGNAQIKFTLQNSKISNFGSVLDLGDGCNEEVMKALLSYRNFKDLPNGNYTLKVGFKLIENNSAMRNKTVVAVPAYQKLSDINIIAVSAPTQNNATEEKIDKVYDFVSIEKQPEFPGGIAKFYEYLGKNIKYPKLAQDNNVQGKVFLSYIVEKDGSLTDITVTRGLGSGTDEEAIRVLSYSPKWNPGITNGQPVRVKYNINVNFSLNSGSEAKKTVVVKDNAGVTNLLKSPKFDGLVVVNGQESKSGLDISDIDSRNIQSVTVLKNASAVSLYGERAKNGVLIITTKTNHLTQAGDADLKFKSGIPALTLKN